MLIERVYDHGLAQAAYVVGCAATGEALVVDPIRDVEPYLEVARREGLTITHVAETHIHADFVSGARELAERTGARLYLSAEGGEAWQYAFAEEYGAELLRDGDTFMVGNVRVEAMHTPGHTPEHLTFLVTDTVASEEPMGAFTGDFLFVGDVGRPDLLERAAHLEGTMESGARDLFRSLARFRELPDHLQIWPGHGAGSACGKSLGAVPQSTLGYEKRVNWGLQHDDPEAFVQAVLEGQPDPPMYFAEMKRINREGPRVLGVSSAPPLLGFDRLDALVEAGAVLVDARDGNAFVAGHLPGSLSVPLGRNFSTWAGSVLPPDRPIALILPTEDPGRARQAVRDLEVIGLDQVVGFFGPGVFEDWSAEGRTLPGVQGVAPEGLERWIEEGHGVVVDVRNHSEWESGHIPGSVNVPLGRLPERVAEIPSTRPVIVHCGTGARGLVGLSALARRGFEPVLRLEGDLEAWKAEGRALVKAPAPELVGGS